MTYIRIKTDALYRDYGLLNQSRHKIVTKNSKGNIIYVRNPKHDPDARPVETSAWVAVFNSECEVLVDG